MVSALSALKADLINLRGWFLYDCRSRFFGYWNLMQKEGLHYRCDQTGAVQLMLNTENNGGLADNHSGMVFLRLQEKGLERGQISREALCICFR